MAKHFSAMRKEGLITARSGGTVLSSPALPEFDQTESFTYQQFNFFIADRSDCFDLAITISSVKRAIALHFT